MNANDNFEKTDLPLDGNDLNNSNVTPTRDTDIEESNNQNKEKIEISETETTPQSLDQEVVQPLSKIEDAEKVEDITSPAKTEDRLEDNETADSTESLKEVTELEHKEDSSEGEDEEGFHEETDEESSPSVKKAIPAVALTFEDIVNKLQELSKKDTFTRKDLDRLQYLFLSECRKETEAQKVKFMDEGGKEEDFTEKESELHTKGKNLLQILAERRKQFAADEEKVKEKNLERKLAIIEEVKVLIESQDDFNKTYQEFKSLQQEWNSIKLVPHGKEHELWKSYQEQAEKFYDLIRIHNEFRDYDFKKNLEIKTRLSESAEKLIEEEDVVSSFHQLQKLHKDWRDVGPVARKYREEIWQRFKTASAKINHNYQTHIESLKEKEGENYDKKVAICVELESIDYSALKDTRDWDAKMREVLNLQTIWREIGYAPRKVNAKIFQRYRAACDLFFKNKNAYYQTIRGELEENLQKKIALCERAEAMKESQDWKKTTADMISIQNEWKEIGMVPRKNSTNVWKRFIAACDFFFEEKKKHSNAQYEAEVENLKLKKEIVDKITNLDTTLSTEDSLAALRDMMTKWHAIGYVPFKEKDKAYKEFIDATDKQYGRLNIDKSERKLDNFKTNIEEMTKSDNSRGQVYYEREKLMRQFERMKSDLQTYENNIGFFSSSSKKGNSLVDDMNNKIEKIKAELELIIKKIDAIDENI